MSDPHDSPFMDAADTLPPEGSVERTGPVVIPPRDSGIVPRANVTFSPSMHRLLEVTLDLHRRTRGEHQEEPLVRAYVETLTDLFPGRAIVVRLLHPEVKNSLTLLHATGRVRRELRERASLSEKAVRRHRLDAATVEAAGITVTHEVEPQIDWTRRTAPAAMLPPSGASPIGIDAPIRDGDSLIGTLIVETPPGSGVGADDGALVGLMASHLGRAVAQVRLRRESARLRDQVRMLLDHAHLPVAALSTDGRVQMMSDAFLEILHRSRPDTVGQMFCNMLPPTERDAVRGMLRSSLKSERAHTDEIRFDLPSGEPVRLAITMAAIRDPDGHVEGALVVGQDLTTLRALEEQVRHADKLATIGHMAAGVVHELNNPLTSVSVYADFLVRKHQGADSDPGDLEKLERIRAAAERLLRFSRNLVTYARPSDDPTALLSVADALEEAVVFCQHVIDERGASVARVYADGEHTTRGVRAQLHQVFINLITNACQAMPEGAGQLTLHTHLTPDEVTVRIHDNGPGVTPEDRERIFEPFVSTKRAGEGTGLGLSIVRNIVTRHGGSIHVEGELGAGAEFVITLPRVS